MNPTSIIKAALTACFIMAAVLTPIVLPAQTPNMSDMKNCPEMGTGHDMANCPMKGTTASNKQAKGEIHSKYAGMEKRRVKSLSDEQIEGYLNGEGMGLAMPAELNHYPGPKHVQSVGEQLKLTGDQSAAIQKAYEVMHENAVGLGKQLVAKETELETLFASGAITDGQLSSLTSEIGALQGKIRATHLSAHLTTKGILSTEQVRRYDELRGYGKPANHDRTKKM